MFFRSESSIRSYSSKLNDGKKRLIADTLGDGLSTNDPAPLLQNACQPLAIAGPSRQNTGFHQATASSLLNAMSRSPVISENPLQAEIWDSEITDSMLLTSASASMHQESSVHQMDKIFVPVFNNCNNVTINFSMPQ